MYIQPSMVNETRGVTGNVLLNKMFAAFKTKNKGKLFQNYGSNGIQELEK